MNLICFDDETNEFWTKDVQNDIGFAYLGGPCETTAITNTPKMYKFTSTVEPKKSIYLSEEPHACFGLCGIGIEPYFHMDETMKFAFISKPWVNTKFAWIYYPLSSWRLIRPMFKKLMAMYEKDKKLHGFCLVNYYELVDPLNISIKDNVVALNKLFKITYKEPNKIRFSTDQINNIILHLIISSADNRSISIKLLEESCINDGDVCIRKLQTTYYNVVNATNGHMSAVRSELLDNIVNAIEKSDIITDIGSCCETLAKSISIPQLVLSENR